MPSRVLIAPDKYKGTLSASDAARAIARGWARIRPADRLELLPISDGGEGFGQALWDMLGADSQSIETLDAAHRPCQSAWWWEAASRTAIIESAQVIGLAMLPPGKFHPFELDTFGLGKVFETALGQGADQFIVGIGGSATNDGGFGLARALGWRFVDGRDHPIERWTELHKLAVVYPPEKTKPPAVTVAVDVQNTLLGASGATRVYGPQKGLRPDDLEMAERCLERLALVMKQQFKTDFAGTPGAGAAGGLGFGLRAFLDARIEPGFELLAEKAGLEGKLSGSDLVVTGEGAIDESTLMGKGVGQLARRCQALGIPCIGLGGSVGDSARTSGLFSSLESLTNLTRQFKSISVKRKN